MKTADQQVPMGSFSRHVLGFLVTHALLFLFLGAFTIRILFVFLYGPSAAPVTWGDDFQYDRIAYGLVTEHHYLNTWYTPGYPLFLSLVYALFGKSLLLVRIIQAVFGATTCALTYRLASKLFTEREGVLAGVLLAVYPGHAYWSWRIMGETLYMLLLVWSVLQALRLVEISKVSRAATLGLTLGFAQLVKTNLFPFPVLLTIWFAMNARTRMRSRVGCIAALVLTMALMACVTPIVYLISPEGRPALLPANSGYGLWQGNNPLADGNSISAEGLPEGKAFVEKHGFGQEFEVADQAERGKILQRLALIWIRENPGKFLKLCAKKLNNALGLFPRAAVFERDSRAKFIHLVTYGPVAAFCLAGMIVTRHRWRDFLLLYLAILSYILMVLIFFGTPRYTILIIPFFLVFASYSMVAFSDWILAYRFRRK